MQAVTPGAIWGLTKVALMYITSTSLQRASIAAVTRQLTTVLLYGGYRPYGDRQDDLQAGQ
jgi:hypothetical protein